MTARLAHLCRHPIKSLGYETISSVRLTEGEAFPFDRRWAVAHEAAAFGARPQGWATKLNFVRGWAEPRLMAIRADSDPETGRVTLTHPERPALTLHPDSAGAEASLLAWLAPLWPPKRPAAAHLVHVDGQAMTDVPEPYVAILSLASLGELSARIGQDLSIHRWRGNLWLDGLAPWAEWDLIGQTLRIGEAELQVEARITRCRATAANPDTGQTDADTLGALQAGFGHQDFGVYARVTRGGMISVGDRVSPP